MEKIKFLMTDTGAQITPLCRQALEAKGVQVTVCEKNGAKALSALLEEHPQAALLDAFMPDLDAITVKQRYEAQNTSGTRTTFFVTGAFQSEEMEQELLDFVDEMEFERLGVFPYSAEEDTPAYSYPDQVPQEVKEARRDAVMELQQDIAFARCEEMKGKVLTVMVEGKVADEPVYVGRTYMDAPNVDGLIFIHSGEVFMSGDFVRVKVTGAAEYDLIGEVYDESAE